MGQNLGVSANMKVASIVQARMGSTRMPGKVMMMIAHKPLLAHVIERLKRVKVTDTVIVATTRKKDDVVIVDCARQLGVETFRGEEQNVLKRYIDAAHRFHVDVVVRATSDNPLVDYAGIDAMIRHLLENDLDYVFVKNLPLGVSAEVVKTDALERSAPMIRKFASNPDHYEEHVTPFIIERPDLFKIQMLEANAEMARPWYRLTVDTVEDLELIRKIYSHLYHRDGDIVEIADVIYLLDSHPELVKINAHIEQKKKTLS